ncbi:hypothetical protein, partial [Bradyrhizobium sp. RT7a]|uniref:hypothetical protein n=1 Tax=Bradyrhizobium sp. RT7a TaxID=3156382 RepID=UPI0033963368
RGPTPRFPAKSNTTSRQILLISQINPHSSRTTPDQTLSDSARGLIFPFKGHQRRVTVIRLLAVHRDIDAGDATCGDSTRRLHHALENR